jgi:uncharacterized protein
MNEMLLGFVVRLLQVLAASAPTILVGVLVAGIFERLIGYDNTQRIFGGRGLRSLVTAWAIGMLLPVCSLGVVPIVRVLQRAGVSGGAILAFALAAPLFNPLSLLYGLTLSRPLVIFVFAGCSLVVVTIVGLVWDYCFPGTARPAPPLPPVAPGLRRMAAVGLATLRELGSMSLVYMSIGMVGSALLAALLPHGALQRSMNGGNPWAPLVMSGVAIPIYATPMLAMSQLGSMFQHGNSVGAAWVLLTFGTGLHAGLIVWLVASYGWRRGAVWLAAMFAVVVGLGYAVDRPLYPTDIEAADHTHALDIYTSPFVGGSHALWAEAQMRIADSVRPFEWRVIYVLAGLAAAGIAINLVDPRRRSEQWLTDAAQRAGPRFDRAIPAPLLGAAALVGLVGFSVFGCYIFYPPADVVFAEMRTIRAEALSAALLSNGSPADHDQADQGQAEHYLALWDDWTRKLEVGTYLRELELSEYRRYKARILRERLELLRHEIEDGDREATREMITKVNLAYERVRRSYGAAAE